MISVTVKDNANIFTIIPESKEEQNLIRQIMDVKSLSEKKMTEREYWSFPNAKKKTNIQMTFDDFVPVTDLSDIPFESSFDETKKKEVAW